MIRVVVDRAPVRIVPGWRPIDYEKHADQLLPLAEATAYHDPRGALRPSAISSTGGFICRWSRHSCVEQNRTAQFHEQISNLSGLAGPRSRAIQCNNCTQLGGSCCSPSGTSEVRPH